MTAACRSNVILYADPAPLIAANLSPQRVLIEQLSSPRRQVGTDGSTDYEMTRPTQFKWLPEKSARFVRRTLEKTEAKLGSSPCVS